MEPQEGETVERLLLPEDTFSREDLRERRAQLHQRGVRSRLEYVAESDRFHGHYRLMLVGPAHEMAWASLWFSLWDDRDFLNPTV